MRKAVVRKYKNSFTLAATIIILFFIADTGAVHGVIDYVGELGAFGAIVTGMFFVSSFTIAPSAIVLFHLAQTFNPFALALYAGIGSTIGDFLIFRFFKDGVVEELNPLFRRMGGSRLAKILKKRAFKWVTPILGALLIVSPFPDEIGIGLMGISRIKTWQFVVLSFFLDVLGILIIALAARA